jgi:hypothetical protein
VGIVHRFPAWEGYGEKGARVEITPDGKRAVVQGPSQGALTVWDTQTGRFLRQLSITTDKQKYSVLDLSVHPNNRYLAAAYETRHDDDDQDDRPKQEAVIIWDLAVGQALRRLRDESPRRMESVAFAPDGTRLLIGYRAPQGKRGRELFNGAELWDWKAEQLVTTIRIDGWNAEQAAFSADGRRLVLGGWGRGISVHDASDGTLLAHVEFQSGIEAGAFTADGKTVVAATMGDGTLFRAEVDQPERHVHSPRLQTRHLGTYPQDLWIANDSQLVYCPCDDGRVSIYRLSNMQLVAELATRGQGDWLAWTAAGYYTGSDGARPYLSWKYAGRPHPLQRFARWAERPDRVAEALAGQDIPPVEFPVDALPATRPAGPPRPSPRGLRRDETSEAIALLRQAGAELKFNFRDELTLVKLDGQPVSDRVLRRLPDLYDVEQLLLANTGIRDEHLRGVGLLTYAKQLSLGGNPITDRGLAELASMWRLEVLDVHDTAVTEVSLKKLRHIASLRTLIVPADVDADKLRSAMARPQLEIIPRKPSP